jgi:hypothetical protein
MTTRMRIVVTDNMDEDLTPPVYTEIGDDGEKVVISLNGMVRELDLTKDHAYQLREEMGPWLYAGHEPGQGVQPAIRPEPPAGEKLSGQGRRREVPGTRDFYKELRDWAAGQDLEIPQAGRADSKKNYVYTALIRPYLDHLREQAAKGQDGGVAAARLAMAALLRLPGTGGS